MNNHWYNEGKEIINQGRTRRQTEGNYKVMGIVLVAFVVGIIITLVCGVFGLEL
jgi:hypothetical protein